MPDACSVDAQRLFTECPLDGQDRPPDGLLQNGLCDFIPNPACQSFFLFIGKRLRIYTIVAFSFIRTFAP